MTEETLPEEVTKDSFRQKIWDYITKNDLGNFPLGVYHRIPNFKGTAEAAQRLSELDEFKKAKVIEINPDKPLETMRLLALEANKEILVPMPMLKSGLFLHVTPVASATKEKLKEVSKRRNLLQAGKPLGVDSNIKIDLVVAGSVCVSRTGYRLGKGKGYADLEFAIMMRMGAVTEDTVIVTTVHDCQIVDNLPPELFKEHDVPVDIIVTPTQTIYVNPRLKKPAGLFWHLLSERRIKNMQVLQQLKEMDEKDGKTITLKEEDSDTETRHRRRYRSRKPFKPKKNAPDVDGAVENTEKTKETKPRLPRKRNRKMPKPEADNNSSPQDGGDAKQKEETENKEAVPRPRRKSRQTKRKQEIDYSLKLSNMLGAKVSYLKSALQERGVKPSKITWRGYQDVCYLHFGKMKNENATPAEPPPADSIIAKLQELRLGEAADRQDGFITVELAKPRQPVQDAQLQPAQDSAPN